MSFIQSSSSTKANLFLLEIVQKLQPIISTLIPFVKAENAKTDIVVMGKADVSVPTVNPKQEYFIYVQRFGPPLTGVFDESALNQIRRELGKPVSGGARGPGYDITNQTVTEPATDS